MFAPPVARERNHVSPLGLFPIITKKKTLKREIKITKKKWRQAKNKLGAAQKISCIEDGTSERYELTNERIVPTRHFDSA
jgi:hypothetical protein